MFVTIRGANHGDRTIAHTAVNSGKTGVRHAFEHPDYHLRQSDQRRNRQRACEFWTTHEVVPKAKVTVVG